MVEIAVAVLVPSLCVAMDGRSALHFVVPSLCYYVQRVGREEAVEDWTTL